MLYCFVDTNIFLQYQTFDEIDWPRILKSSAVCLVVPYKVVRELDKLKYDSTSDRRRSRAIVALRKISEYRDDNGGRVRAQTAIQVEVSSPSANWLESNSYDPSDADDCIVGAIQFFSIHNTNASVILFSGDYGIRLKAESRGMDCVTPPEELKLVAEPDPLQQENHRLQRELQRLRNAQPKLALMFEDTDGNLSNKIECQVSFEKIKLLEDEIEQRLMEKFELEKYDGDVKGEISRKVDENELDLSTLAAFHIPPIGAIYPTREEVDTYHEKLNRYIQNEYRNYLLQLHDYQNRERLTHPIRLVLENTGTAPARNVDVWLHFPDGFQILDEQFYPPNEPYSPQKPKIRNMLDSLLGDSIMSLPYTSSNSSISNYVEPSGPTISIRKTNSYEIEWGAVDLKHNLVFYLPELYLLFEPLEKTSTGFEVEYEITADNLQDKVEGKLVILLHSV